MTIFPDTSYKNSYHIQWHDKLSAGKLVFDLLEKS